MVCKIKKRKNILPFTKPSISQAEIREVTDTLRSGWLTTGPKTAKFTNQFKKFAGAKHAIALNSATAGLHLAYTTAGIKPKEEILTSPLTFCATANCAIHAGTGVNFADINIDTLNIDINAINSAVKPKTKIIVPIHFVLGLKIGRAHV